MRNSIHVYMHTEREQIIILSGYSGVVRNIVTVRRRTICTKRSSTRGTDVEAEFLFFCYAINRFLLKKKKNVHPIIFCNNTK